MLFSETEYSVSEGNGFVEVCVTILGAPEGDALVQIQAIDNNQSTSGEYCSHEYQQ